MGGLWAGRWSALISFAPGSFWSHSEDLLQGGKSGKKWSWHLNDKMLRDAWSMSCCKLSQVDGGGNWWRIRKRRGKRNECRMQKLKWPDKSGHGKLCVLDGNPRWCRKRGESHPDSQSWHTVPYFAGEERWLPMWGLDRQKVGPGLQISLLVSLSKVL